MSIPDDSGLSQEINEALIAYELWAEANATSSVEEFIKTKGFPDTVAAELRKAFEREFKVHELLTSELEFGPKGPPEIDGFQFVECLGEGGMGSVWLANQLAPLQRTVAVKLMRNVRNVHEAIGRETLQARFERERQAHALMSHSNIATVFAAGQLESNVPYLVMEYVDGEPITTYCESKRLPLAGRLALFTQVCDAIQHAHQKGLLHRDIKPANILVTEQEGDPTVKVIDFGISKFESESAEFQPQLTQADTLIGSPLWMSPEQLSPRAGASPDTRSDVYSLGILLYQLLTGTTPVQPHEFSVKSKLEVLELIRTRDIERPSTRFAENRAKGKTPATTDSLVAWKTKLKSELDWVVLKAVAQVPEKRYPSVSDLANDIRRFLRDEPLEAHAPSFLYRVKKLATQNRAATYSIAAVALTLLAATLFSTSVAWWAFQQQKQAKRSAREAEAAAEIATLAQLSEAAQKEDVVVIAFLLLDEFKRLDIRQAGHQWNEQTEGTLERLITGVQRVNPELRADLLRKAATPLAAIGKLNRAREITADAVEIYQSLSGIENEKIANTIIDLARHNVQLQDFAEAKRTLEKLNQIDVSEVPFSDETLARIEVLEIQIELNLKGPTDPIARLEALVASGQLESPSRETAAIAVDVYSLLGTGYYSCRELERSVTWYRKAKVLSDETFGTGHANSIRQNLLYWQCLSYLPIKQLPEGIESYVENLSTKFGVANEFTLQANIALGKCLSAVGQHDKAIDQLSATLATSKRELGSMHLGSAEAAMELGYAFLRGRNLKQAEQQLKFAADTYDSLRGPGFVKTLLARLRLGEARFTILVMNRGVEDFESRMEANLDFASDLVEQAIADLGEDSDTAHQLIDLKVRCLFELNRTTEAVAETKRVLTLIQKCSEPGAVSVQNARYRLASIAAMTQKHKESVEQLSKLYELKKSHPLMSKEEFTKQIALKYVNSLLAENQAERVIDIVETELEQMDGVKFLQFHREYFQFSFKFALAEAHTMREDYEKAESILVDALRNPERMRAPAYAALGMCALGLIVSERGDFEEGERLLTEAYDLISQANSRYGTNKSYHWIIKRCEARLVQVNKLKKKQKKKVADKSKPAAKTD